VILAGTNNHEHTTSQIIEGLVEIIETCQEKQPQADVLVMVSNWALVCEWHNIIIIIVIIIVIIQNIYQSLIIFFML